MKIILELLIEDLHKIQASLDQLRRVISLPLDLGLERHSLNVIEELHALVDRTEDNYQRMNLKIDDILETVDELEQSVSESYNSINKRFDFWLHDVVDDRSESVAFLDFFLRMQSSGQTYAYFVNELAGGNSILICMPISSYPRFRRNSALATKTKGTDRSDSILAFSKYVESPRKWLRPLRKLGHKLFKKPNKWVYHLFSTPRKDRTHGTFKGKEELLLKEYRPFKYDAPDQLSKILYDFINMHGVKGRHCANLITDRKVYAIFMSEQSSVMTENQVKFTMSTKDDKGSKQRSGIIVFL